MPAVIDHEQRRRQLAGLVADIILRSGLEAVTVRSVAAAAGCSTAVVSHYFANKRELLLYSYRMAAVRANARLEAAAASGERDPAQVLGTLLPLNAAARRDWLVWAAFWGVAIADPVFSAEQKRQFRSARIRFARLLAGARRGDSSPGSAAESTTHRETARRVLTALIGLTVQAAFDPRDWPARRQRAYLAAALGRSAPGERPTARR